MKELESYFSALGISMTQELRSDLQVSNRIILRKGQYLLREGQYSRSIAFIAKGKIRHFYNIDGDEYTRWVSLSGHFVTAFTSFINDTPSTENLHCLEDAELISFTREHFQSIRNKYSHINELWTKNLESEMIGYEERVTALITSDSEKRYLNFIEKYKDFESQVPQKYIASMLGIAPRHLSRIRNKLSSRTK